MQCITREAGVNPRAPSEAHGALVRRLAAAAAGRGLSRDEVGAELADAGMSMTNAPSQVKQLAIAAWHRHEWLLEDDATLARAHRLRCRARREEVLL